MKKEEEKMNPFPLLTDVLSSLVCSSLSMSAHLMIHFVRREGKEGCGRLMCAWNSVANFHSLMSRTVVNLTTVHQIYNLASKR